MLYSVRLSFIIVCKTKRNNVSYFPQTFEMVIGKVLLQNIDVSALSFQNYVLCNRIPYFLRIQNTDQLDVFVRIAFVFWNKCCDVVNVTDSSFE